MRKYNTVKTLLLVFALLMVAVFSLMLASCEMIDRIQGEKPEGIADWDALEKNPGFNKEYEELIQPDQVYTGRTGLSGQELIDYMNSPEYEAYMEIQNAADGNTADYDPAVIAENTVTGEFRFDEEAAEITGVEIDPEIVEMNRKIMEEAGEEFEDYEDNGDDIPEISSGNTDSLPDKYAKLIPDTVLANTSLMVIDSTYMLSGTAGKSEYQAVVNAFKKAGYETVQEMERDGMLLYTAGGKDDDFVTVTYYDGEFSLVIVK